MQVSPPAISICIPAYKRTDFLRRLLDSIAVQTFTDYEVIVTDDSPGGEVEGFCAAYQGPFTLRYIRNRPALGTPENWNEGIRHARGAWIKLMHDDDWFSGPDSLQKFADATREHPDCDFFFSAYTNFFAGNGTKEEVRLSSFRWKQLLKNPVSLFSSNIIGPPSVTLHRNDRRYWYDKTVKWVVDIDFYIRYLQTARPFYIGEPLINVGINAEQVTQSSFRIAEVEIPENFYLLTKMGTKHLHNLMVYDAWWRLMRNLNIKDTADIQRAGFSGEIPPAVASMIRWQSRLPAALIKTGPFSKTFMLLNYLRNYLRLK